MLVDIDKLSADRGTPMPNTHDVLGLSALSAHGTNSVNYVTPGTNLPIIAPAKSGQFSVVQSGNIPVVDFTATSAVGSYVKGSFIHGQVPHNLTFTPTIVGYLVDSRGEYFNMSDLFMNGNGTTTGMIWSNWRFAVDSTYVYLINDYLITGTSVITKPAFLRYYLLQQTSN